MQTMSGYGLIRDTELEKLKLESRAYLRFWLMLLRVNSGGKCKLHVGSGTRDPQPPQPPQNLCWPNYTQFAWAWGTRGRSLA